MSNYFNPLSSRLKTFFKNASNLSTIKDVVGLVALLIGAGWALYNFHLKDRPAYAMREKASSTLKWEYPEQDDYLHAEFYVTLENAGLSKFTVSRATYWVWSFDPGQFCPDKKFCAIDIQKIRKAKKDTLYTGIFENKSRDSAHGAPFIATFDQGMVWSENLEFLMTSDTTHMVAFYIEFYQGDSCDRQVIDYTYHWDYVGGLKKKHKRGERSDDQKATD